MTVEFPQQDPNERSGSGVIPCAVTTIVISTTFVAARLYSRWGLLRTIGWEDGFILLALVFSYGTSAGMISQLYYGLGQHTQFVPEKMASYTASGLFTTLSFTLSLTFTKISILCLYIRILTYEKVRLLGKILLAIVVLSHTWIIITILLACVPLQSFWDWTVKPKFCMPATVYWGNAALNMGTDFLIFSLPLPVIVKLRIAKRQNIGLYVVFLLAFEVCIVSLVRMVWLIQMHDKVVNSFYDISWEAVLISVWTMIEVNAVIVCACMTTLRPLLSRLFPRFLGSRESSLRQPDDRPDVVRRYERPLTIGTQPNRLQAIRDSDDSSFILNDGVIPTTKSEADVHDRRDHEGRERYAKSLQDAEAQLIEDVMHGVETKGLHQPSKSHIRPAESHDSLRRYPSTPLSHHRGF